MEEKTLKNRMELLCEMKLNSFDNLTNPSHAFNFSATKLSLPFLKKNCLQGNSLHKLSFVHCWVGFKGTQLTIYGHAPIWFLATDVMTIVLDWTMSRISPSINKSYFFPNPSACFHDCLQMAWQWSFCAISVLKTNKLWSLLNKIQKVQLKI